MKVYLKQVERSIRRRIPTRQRNMLRPYLSKWRSSARSLVNPRRPFATHPPRAESPPPAGRPGLVSVIIPIHDRTHELREAIESVRAQSYTDWELILVTDGSPPATMEVIDAYRDDARIRVYSYLDKSGTAVRGRNRGIKEARGEYVAFLDSDDIAAPGRLAISVREMERGGYDVVYGAWTAKIDGSRRFEGLRDGQLVTSPPCDLLMLERICVPCQSTVMVRRQALLDVGGLKPEMRYREDHELWMRLAYFGYRFGAISENLVHLRLHAGNNELNFKHDDVHWERQAKATYRRKSRLTPTIAYLIPGTGISGGIAVILEHVNRLRRAGYDVFMISQDNQDSIPWWPGNEVPIVPFDTRHRYLLEGIDTLVATGWTTVRMLDQVAARRKLYFVQSDERRFDDSPDFKREVHETYLRRDVEYVTMAGWICRWLKQEFGHNCDYVPNGIDVHRFRDVQPLAAKGRKVRILLEGPIVIPFKGMAEAAAAVADCGDCEVWIVSSAGRPQPGWRCDRFMEAVPHGDMAAIYASCDILLKLSRVESFSYPPLEMMATGGSVVVQDVTGLEEYAVDGENCLIVSDVDTARKAIRRLIDDPALRARLGAAGRATAAGMGWDRSMPSLLRSVGGEATASVLSRAA
jgi:glycosyltransferase involved in cell wall biosynthesis